MCEKYTDWVKLKRRFKSEYKTMALTRLRRLKKEERSGKFSKSGLARKNQGH